MLIIVLLVALLVGFLAVTQMGGLGFGKTNTQQEQTQQNVIAQAQSAVDAINNRPQQSGLDREMCAQGTVNACDGYKAMSLMYFV